jgi:hypothetical protein
MLSHPLGQVLGPPCAVVGISRLHAGVNFLGLLQLVRIVLGRESSIPGYHVCSWCPRIHTVQKQQTSMMSKQTWPVDLSGEGLLCYARPHLFFNCTVAPIGQLERKARHAELSFVLREFSTFEPIKLTPNSNDLRLSPRR